MENGCKEHTLKVRQSSDWLTNRFIEHIEKLLGGGFHCPSYRYRGSHTPDLSLNLAVLVIMKKKKVCLQEVYSTVLIIIFSKSLLSLILL